MTDVSQPPHVDIAEIRERAARPGASTPQQTQRDRDDLLELLAGVQSGLFVPVKAEPAPPPPTLCFLDTETTGLHPELHEVWEVGLIVRKWVRREAERFGTTLPAEEGYVSTEYLWQLPVDLGRADPVGLKISGFHERRWRSCDGPAHIRERAVNGQCNTGLSPAREQCPLPAFASRFAELTRGAHLIGNVVSFDERRLDVLLRANGALPEWHYHLIDVEALAVGWIAALRHQPQYLTHNLPVTPPWKSDDLMKALGVEGPTDEDRHTALGDARWARDVYDRVMS